MRFVWAVVAFLAAAALVGAGVMQLNSLRAAETTTSEIEVPDTELPYTVVDADVLKMYPGQQGIEISGAGDEEIFVAYGRTSDMTSWLSDAAYNHVRSEGASSEETGEPVVTAEVVEPTNEFEDTGERVWWNPRAADVWIEEITAEGELVRDFTLPQGMSILISTNGNAPAPSDISVTWTTSEETAPWAGPLIVLGCVVLLIGLFFWIAGFVHMRRRRGPRRKGSKLPKTEPIEKAPSGRASRRRAFVALPSVIVAGAMLASCSPAAWPEFDEEPTPTPTAEPEESVDAETPAVTEAQAERIVADVSQVMKDANDNADAEMASKRLTGAALSARETAYDIAKDVDDWKLPPVVPDGPVSVLLPQANDGWPRSALMVVGDAESETAPTILMTTQRSPWENYKVSYMAAIPASTALPELAPSWLGAALVPPDSSFLQVAPDELADAYADTLENGEDSDYADVFDLETDPFRQALNDKRDSTRENFNETAEGTAKIRFGQRAGGSDPLALATFNSGAIVAVTLTDMETVWPTEEDGIIKDLNPEIQHFVGEEETSTGVRTAYDNVLFFSVPAKASDEPIRVLGYSDTLSGSELLPEEEDEGE